MSGNEESRELKKVGNRRDTAVSVSGEQSVSGPRLLSCQQERGCQDSEMTSANRMERKWHHQTRMSKERIVREKKTSRQTAGNRKGCQDSKMTRASQIKRQWQHQTRMPKARNVKDKDFQEITESTAVPARRSGAVPIGSPLSL